MSNFQLGSREGAEIELAELLLRDPESVQRLSGQKPLLMTLQVREDKCFEDKWIAVGKIELFPVPSEASSQETVTDRQRIIKALHLGFFEWSIPSQNELIKEIESVLPQTEKEITQNQQQNQQKKIAEATKTVAHIAVRCGLAYPVFDALMLDRLQWRRPLSIVVDTNAVLQGGLDFFAKHVTPQARIKVPALVHMEILNFGERYFSQRRKEKYTLKMLVDHLNSQGGQRALVRLEMDQRVEFERPRLGADPLRGVITPDSDAEDKNLGLQQIQRSFADRLILETAVQHRAQVGPGHPVMLLTSDQGLARMALAEGIQPVFFDSNAVSQLFGQKLSGTGFVPFSSDGPKMHSTGLIDVLWEFAATFGASRVVCDSGKDKIALEVVALGEEVTWQPYHSYEDLLWSRVTNPVGVEARANEKKQSEEQRAKTTRTPPTRAFTRAGKYSFSASSMLRLLSALHDSGEISDETAMSTAGVKSVSGYREYYNFLVAGEFANHEGRMLRKTDALDELLMALREEDYPKISEWLCRVASFRSFLGQLTIGEALRQQDSGFGRDSFRSYGSLAEICCLGVRFVDRGIFGTPNNPRLPEFVASALKAYEDVRAGEGFALTGAWLEKLATEHGIHPVRARQRLAESHQGGYIRRFFEGSTPDTRFENRTIQILEANLGQPSVRTINLYHGDFLMSGRASVSIKLLKGEEP